MTAEYGSIKISETFNLRMHGLSEVENSLCEIVYCSYGDAFSMSKASHAK